MDPDERKAIIAAASKLLSTFNLRTTHFILENSGSEIRHPIGKLRWPFMQPEAKRAAIASVLAYQSEPVIRSLNDQLEKEYNVTTERSRIDPDGSIFVVHGHTERLSEVQLLLERATSRKVTVLHEQPNRGRLLLQKFEVHAQDAAYAVVLLTGDDRGKSAKATGSTKARARQNVVFELGYFMGILGNERVAALLEPGVEKPSDIEGVVYITFDQSDNWKNQLGQELRELNIDFDAARIV
ncbi:TIR domain-containing protein [Streptomyces sp. Marseille-Q5077]|uniref:TIR domain-containing protein n=1 Tax=Streptomyces sp. Marseille-Q5077 TaxID=3418995 RepID=UPI003D008628